MRYLLILLSLILAAHAELRVIKSATQSYAVDPARIIAIEPYVVYVSNDNWFQDTDNKSVFDRIPRVYTPIVKGCRVILERHDSNIQMANGGSGLFDGGNASNISQPSAMILLGVTVDSAINQLYPAPSSEPINPNMPMGLHFSAEDIAKAKRAGEEAARRIDPNTQH